MSVLYRSFLVKLFTILALTLFFTGKAQAQSEDKVLAPADIKCEECIKQDKRKTKGRVKSIVYITYELSVKDSLPYWVDRCGFLHTHDASFSMQGFRCSRDHYW